MTQCIRSRLIAMALMIILSLALAMPGVETAARTAGEIQTATEQSPVFSPAGVGNQVWLPLVANPAPRVDADAWTTVALNLRAGPSTDHATLQVIPSGAQVYVHTGPYNSAWYHITYQDTTGYVHGDYLTYTPPPPPDLLPDLGMAPLQDIYIQTLADGRRLLRFSSIIVNVGTGPFEVRGQRPNTGTALMSTSQRIYNAAGGYRDVATSAVMFYAGDGHDHWHVRDLQRFELERLDNGAKVGSGAKRGFCFWDNYRYGSSRPPVYTNTTNPPACGRWGDLRVTMGLAVGWGDIYHHNLAWQYVDVTGLAAGRYRLWATADPSGWFQETNDRNNVTWVDLQLQGNSVRIAEYGPAIESVK
jgi:hypothetical protein